MIRIITYNRSVNYGALLQAYALKESIKKYVEVELLNYNNKFVEKKESVKLLSKSFFKNILRTLQFRKKYKRSHAFIKAMASEKIYQRENLIVENFSNDKIIVGSDQVWNYNCSGSDTTFLLDWCEKAKKYSYAASFGVSELTKNQIPVFKESLSKFRYISVRERTGQAICKEQLNLDAEIVLDPTLLITKEEWKKRFNIEDKDNQYILVYSFSKNKEFIETVKYISKLTGLPIYNISISVKDFFGDKVIKNAGPKEWLELFYNATFIVTDSFHGTAFSVNFNKPFYVFAKNAKASRIVDLLDVLGLQNRLNPVSTDINLKMEIDYNSVNEKLEIERTKSIAFIEKIIND